MGIKIGERWEGRMQPSARASLRYLGNSRCLPSNKMQFSHLGSLLSFNQKLSEPHKKTDHWYPGWECGSHYRDSKGGRWLDVSNGGSIEHSGLHLFTELPSCLSHVYCLFQMWPFLTWTSLFGTLIFYLGPPYYLARLLVFFPFLRWGNWGMESFWSNSK